MATTKDRVIDPVRQFNVFTENRVGRLCDVVKVFNSHSIHVLALTVLDTTDSAILRLVVDDPEQARELLMEHGFHYYENLLLAVELRVEHDLQAVLQALLEAEVNVHYLYCFLFRPGERSALAISVDDMEIARHVLESHRFKVLGQADISR